MMQLLYETAMRLQSEQASLRAALVMEDTKVKFWKDVAMKQLGNCQDSLHTISNELHRM